MPDRPVAILSSAGFRGYTCMFCYGAIPLEDAGTELELRVGAGQPSDMRFWAHRRCFRDAVHPTLRTSIEESGRGDRFFPPAP